jgi:hypothetical protein
VALDASVIAQAGRSINTPFQNLAGMLEIQQAQQAQQINAQKLAAEQRKAQQQQMVQQTITKHQGDWEKALPELRALAPELSIDIEQQLGKARTERASAFKAELANESALTDRYLARLRAIPEGDEELYQFVRSQMARDLPEEAAMLPPQYDGAKLQQFAQMGLSAKESLDLQQKGLDRILEGKWREGAGTVLSTATDPAEWDEMLTGLRELGMPASEAAQFGAYSPENVQRAARLAMTPAERSQAEDRAEGREIQRAGQQIQMSRDEAAAAERAIDNKRADAQLGISRAQLGLSQQRLTQAQATAGQQKPLTATAESNIINRLSNQWTAATKTPRELDRAITLMDTGLAAARRGDLAAGSQAVLITFQKILDPNSVVRESEYDRSATGQSMYNRVAGAFERLTQGGAGVRLDELEKFAQLAKEAAKAQKSAIGPIRERIGKTADRYNIPRELVIEGVAAPDAAAAPSAPAAPASGGSSRYQRYLQQRGRQ